MEIKTIHSKSNALWDQSVSDGQRGRQQLGAYGILLAEQEDQGSISHEEAESKYATYQAKSRKTRTSAGDPAGPMDVSGLGLHVNASPGKLGCGNPVAHRQIRP